MVTFYINNQLCDVTLEDEKTIGDVLHSFELTCEANKAAVIGITVDDKMITAENFDEEAKNPLSENTKFNFTVITEEMIKDAFNNLSVLFEELSEKMEKVPVDLQCGNKKEVTVSIKELADNIDQFCHFATLATLFPETFKNTKIDNMNFQDFFSDFSPILLDFEQALQNDDTVLIGDLSEYEICPRLKAISSALKQIV